MSKLSIFYTSDQHAFWLEGNKPGSSNLVDTASYMKELSSQQVCESLLIDLGDFIQGSSFASYCHEVLGRGEVFARMMNDMNYDYQIIGNHEFNFGLEYQQEVLKQINAQVLAANIINKETRTPFYGKAYDVIERAGMRIGIIGLTTHYIPHWELEEHYPGIAFLDAFETAKKYVKELRPLVDLLIVAYHGGVERDLVTGLATEEETGENQGYKMFEELPEVDIVLTGHQHRRICHQEANRLIMQPGYGGECVGHIEVEFTHETGLKVYGRLLEVPREDQVIVSHGCPNKTYIAGRQATQTLIAPELNNAKEWLDEILGYATIEHPLVDSFHARLKGHPYLEFLNYLMLKRTSANFAGQALLNDAFNDFKGAITRKTLMRVYPYQNKIALVSMTGTEIWSLVEHNLKYFDWNESEELQVNPSYIEPKQQHYNFDIYSGISIYCDLRQPVGNRIYRLVDESTGKDIDLLQSYTMAATHYRAMGGGNHPGYGVTKIIDLTDIDMRDLIQWGLLNLTTEEWQRINMSYQHLWCEQASLHKIYI